MKHIKNLNKSLKTKKTDIMEIEYVVKIKEKHNPPVFDKQLGKGVVAKIVIDYKDVDVNQPMFQKHLYEKANDFLNEYFEVILNEKI